MEMNDYETRLKRSALLVRDPDVNEYLSTLTCRIAGPYCPDVRVYLIRNPGFNASMAPNGMMQVWTGLFLRVGSEDELASILGHEIAHYTRAHSIERFRKLKKNLTVSAVFGLGLGIIVPMGPALAQNAAIANALAFSREQESEADLLGARMMMEAGLDPHATYRVWETLIEEERMAVAKADQPALFMRTHPQSEARATTLRTYVKTELAPTPAEPQIPNLHIATLMSHYVRLMEDQIDTNRYGRTEAILKRHEAGGVDPSMIAFFRGEMYRQRNGEGDRERARLAYLTATDSETPHPEAHRNLGYWYLKEHNQSEAMLHFARYLELQPLASDRAMIEFYLGQEPNDA
jgi:predicted Zn-dependent protease